MGHRYPRFATAALSLGLAIVTLGGASAADARSGSVLVAPFQDLSAVPDQALADQRGGIRVNGFDMNIAVRIETRVNGRLQMLSTLLADAADRITRRTELLGDRFDDSGLTGPTGQESVPRSGTSVAAKQQTVQPSVQQASVNPQTAVSRGPGSVAGTGSTQQSAPLSTVSGSDQPNLSVQHMLQGALGTRVVNRLNGQRIQNRIEMTVTLRNYRAIQQHAQRVRALGAAVRAATAAR